MDSSPQLLSAIPHTLLLAHDFFSIFIPSEPRSFFSEATGEFDRKNGIRIAEGARLLSQWFVPTQPIPLHTEQTYSLTFYSPIDLKSTTDDAFTPYLCTLPQPYTFTRDNSKTTIRFILGYTAVAIAGVTFYLDRQLGWEATEAAWVRWAVGAYFLLNTLLQYWIWAVEAGEVFRGVRKDGNAVRIPPVPTTLFAGGKRHILTKLVLGGVDNHPIPHKEA